MRQEQIMKRQVERLIGGTLNGYDDVLSLDGNSYTVTSSNGLYRAVSKVTVNNSAELDKIVENMIGVTLKTTIPKRVLVDSKIYDEFCTAGDIDEFSNRYSAGLDHIKDHVAHTIEQDKQLKQQYMADFKNAMLELEDSYNSKNPVKVADAIEKVAAISNWGSSIKVKPVYDAAKGIESTLLSNARVGVDEAWRAYRKLENVLEFAKVRNVFMGIRGGLVEPNSEQVYTGPLDHELIARDILNNK